MSAVESPEAALPEKKRRRWRVRWSLRVLISAVTLVCLLFAWAANERRIGHVHQEVGAKLLALQSPGRLVRVEWKMDTVRTVAARGSGLTRSAVAGTFQFRQKHDPPWWMKVSGVDLIFQRIGLVQIERTNDPRQLDEAVELLALLDQPPSIELNVEGVSEEQIEAAFSKIPITSLPARHARLSEGSLPFLNCPGLLFADVSYTRFSNKAIKDLPDSLKAFIATNTQITDEGLGGFKRLENLEHLDLSGTPTSLEAIERLRKEMPLCKVTWLPPKTGKQGLTN